MFLKSVCVCVCTYTLAHVAEDTISLHVDQNENMTRFLCRQWAAYPACYKLSHALAVRILIHRETVTRCLDQRRKTQRCESSGIFQAFQRTKSIKSSMT